MTQLVFSMPSHTAVAAFDYTSLDRDTAQFLQQQTGEIRALMRRTAQDIFEIGQKLINIKQRLRHGQFLSWLEVEFDWSYPTAARFMQVASSFEKQSYQIDKFAPSALYVLAAPSTPEAARSEALARAASGEDISHRQALSLKQKYRPQPASPSTTNGETAKAEDKPLEIVSLKKASDKLWLPLGEHWLFAGHPNSPDFHSRLPDALALWLAFPPQPQDWQPSLLPSTKAALSFYLNWEQQPPLDQEDFQWMVTLLDTNLKLYSQEEQEAIVLAFVPTPGLLLVAQEWGCRCFLADPDPRRCQAVLEAFNVLDGRGKFVFDDSSGKRNASKNEG